MNPSTIYSKSGKGVQEASGKTSLLKRPDRAVLSAIDGRATLKEVAEKVGRTYDAPFQAVVQQLDKDGFIREVSSHAGAAPAPASRPGTPPPSRPAPAKPGAAMDPASDLDFSSLGGTRIGGITPAKPAAQSAARPAPPPPPSRPAAPAPQQSPQAKAQQSALDKAREEREAKAAAERERVRKEVEDKARAELEVKMRAEAEQKMKDEAEARLKAAAAAEAEAKVKAAREAALRAAAEAKAKAEAEAKAKLEAERKAREEMERRLEAERKAREEAERKAKEEAERIRREAEEKARREAEEKARREAEELRQRLEAERKARLEEEAKRQEAERKAKEEVERARLEAEEKARLMREEAERKAQAEADRVRRELEAERRQLEEERRRQEEDRAALAAAQAVAGVPAPPAKPANPESFADSLMSDLDSFTNKDEEEQKARAEAEQQTRAEAERRRREAAEREAAEARRRQEEGARREQEEARRREEDKRKAREEEERLAREEERRRREAEEIQRKAEAATAAAMAKQAGAAAEQDIPIGDDDLDMDEVKKERKALGIDEKKLKEKEKEAERQARKRKRAEEKRRREAEKAAAKAARVVAPSGRARPASSWGRPVALFLLVVLAIAVGVAQFVPLDVAPFEQAATEALGQPVSIGSARLSLYTGVQLRFENVRIGNTLIARAAAHPALTSLLGKRKDFNLIELEGLSLPQEKFGEALFAKVKGSRLSVERIKIRDLALPGRLVLPKPLEADISLDARGMLRSASVRGPDGLDARVVPKGEALELQATAAGFPLPIAPDVTLSQFAMKGTASRFGLDIAEWGGAIYNGAVSGTAKVRWGSTWEVDGVLTVRGINAAVFAPALLSEGNAEGTGRFSMSGPDPARLLATSRVDGRFRIGKGTLGSFDLARAIQTRGKDAKGTTQFAELDGQVSYDAGAVALRNLTLGAGALNAGASADITKTGALSGRIVADVRTAAQTLSATLNLAGTLKEPQVRD